MEKLIIFSAPSGSGKTTLVKKILGNVPNLGFSISACTRIPRPEEIDGKDYYFLTPEKFKLRVEKGHFAEWEEVYANNYYGTLKTEIQRLWNKGKSVIFDVDVKGGLSLKKAYGEKALAIFVKVPDFNILRNRLKDRGTENEASLQRRLEKCKYEMSYEPEFDTTVVNDKLENSVREATLLVKDFLEENINMEE